MYWNAKNVYKEKLSGVADLIVTPEMWQIQFIFQGPDGRHNPTFVYIASNEIDKYIIGLRDAWLEFKKLTAQVPKGTEVKKTMPPNLTVMVGGFGGYFNGVCLTPYTRPIITTEQDLIQVVASFEHSKNRAAQAKQFLAGL